MSALPRSIGSRLLPTTLRPSVARVIAPQYRTYASKEAESKTDASDAPAVNLTESSQIRKETAKEGIRHQPDYNVALDYRTSYVIDT
jgi:NADH dehydrogenase (ubiquinone) Fe-S protein 4